MSVMSRYDQWRTREPDYGPDYTWEMQEHCAVCGCWLKLASDFTEDKEDLWHCDGTLLEDVQQSMCGRGVVHPPHDEIGWAWVEIHRKCKRCGYDNVEVA